MKQLGQIGIVAVRKLASAGITSLEALEITEPSRIDAVMSKNPPFGKNLLARLKDFPKPRVTVKMMGKETKPGKPVKIKFKAEIGFLNENAPAFYNRNLIYVCFLAETSDGRLIEFRRMAAKTLQNGHETLLSADLYHQSQYIACHVSCDEIAGTSRYAELKPDLPASLFSAHQPGKAPKENPAMNISKRRAKTSSQLTPDEDEFGDDGLDESDLLAAAQAAEFISIEVYEQQARAQTNKKGKSQAEHHEAKEPVQLENGKWACNHNCKDKTSCKHFCCRDGLDKPPKVTKKKEATKSIEKPDDNIPMKKNKAVETGQTTLNLGSRLPGTKKRTNSIEKVNLTGDSNKKPRKDIGNQDQKKLNRLHKKTINSTSFTPIGHNPLPSSYAKGKKPRLSYLSDSSSIPEPEKPQPNDKIESDYSDDNIFDDIDLPSTEQLLAGIVPQARKSPKPTSSSHYDDDISSLEVGMIGLQDSFNLTSHDAGAMQLDEWNDPFGPMSPPAGTTTTQNDPQNSLLNSGPIGSSSTVKQPPSSGGKLFVMPGSDEHLAEFARRLTSKTESTPVKKSQGVMGAEIMDAGRKKVKRDKSEGGERPLSSRENAPGVDATGMNTKIGGARNENAGKDEDGKAVKKEVKGEEVKEEKPWWEGDDIDPDFIREFGPYVNFV